MPFQAQRVGSEIDAHYTNAAVLGVSPSNRKEPQNQAISQSRQDSATTSI